MIKIAAIAFGVALVSYPTSAGADWSKERGWTPGPNDAQPAWAPVNVQFSLQVAYGKGRSAPVLPLNNGTLTMPQGSPWRCIQSLSTESGYYRVFCSSGNVAITASVLCYTNIENSDASHLEVSRVVGNSMPVRDAFFTLSCSATRTKP